MPTEMNLSDALDLIAQSKSDIKASVQGKGGTIGDDLTEYSSSISNIPFSYLSSELFNRGLDTYSTPTTIPVEMYDSATHQLVNIDPSDITVSVSPTMIQDLEAYSHLTYDPNIATVTKEYLWPEQQQGTVIRTIANHTGGKCNVVVHYDKGNIDYIGTLFAGDSLEKSIEIGSAKDSSDNTLNTTSNWIQIAPKNTIKIYLNAYVNNGAYTLTSADTFELLSYNLNTPYNYSWDGTCLTLTPRGTRLNGVDSVELVLEWDNPGRELHSELTFTISQNEPVTPVISSPSDGEHIEAEIDPEGDGYYKYGITVDNVDDVSALSSYLTLDDTSETGIHIEPIYGDEEGVEIGAQICIPPSEGEATLTYDDGTNSCSSTFTYNITEPSE